MIQLLILSFLILSLISIPLVYADHNSHDYVKKISIESDEVDSTLTDFPLLINFTDSDLSSKAFSDGLRITFTNSANSTELSHEIEQYTSGSGWLTAWVKIPTVSSSTDTDIFMWYGNNTNIVQQNNTSDTWNSNYETVYHLHDDFLDSTSNNHDAINQGSTDTDSQIADGQEFDGINDEIEDADGESYIDGLSSITVSAWIEADAVAIDDDFLRWNDGAFDNGNMRYDDAGFAGGGNDVLKIGIETTGGETAYESATLTQTTDWQYAVMTWTSTESIKLYLDGTLDSPTSAGSSVTGTITSSEFFQISPDSGKGDWDGEIDEVRFSNSVRSADWIDFEYCNQVDETTCDSIYV